jgi:hypothetical protein
MATSTELQTGGFFALGGVLLTKVFDLLGNSSKAKHDLRRELRAKHFEKKLDVYRKLAVAFEPMVERQRKDCLRSFFLRLQPFLVLRFPR